MFEVNVSIGLKEGISDPEGANTLKALKLLGFDNILEAKTTRTINLLIDSKEIKEVKKNIVLMCQQLLINPVIHTYKINISKK